MDREPSARIRLEAGPRDTGWLRWEEQGRARRVPVYHWALHM